MRAGTTRIASDAAKVRLSDVADERRKLRKQLLAYCERDTLALVRLVERLAQIAR